MWYVSIAKQLDELGPKKREELLRQILDNLARKTDHEKAFVEVLLQENVFDRKQMEIIMARESKYERNVAAYNKVIENGNGRVLIWALHLSKNHHVISEIQEKLASRLKSMEPSNVQMVHTGLQNIVDLTPATSPIPPSSSMSPPPQVHIPPQSQGGPSSFSSVPSPSFGQQGPTSPYVNMGQGQGSPISTHSHQNSPGSPGQMDHSPHPHPQSQTLSGPTLTSILSGRNVPTAPTIPSNGNFGFPPNGNINQNYSQSTNPSPFIGQMMNNYVAPVQMSNDYRPVPVASGYDNFHGSTSMDWSGTATGSSAVQVNFLQDEVTVPSQSFSLPLSPPEMEQDFIPQKCLGCGRDFDICQILMDCPKARFGQGNSDSNPNSFLFS